MLVLAAACSLSGCLYELSSEVGAEDPREFGWCFDYLCIRKARPRGHNLVGGRIRAKTRAQIKAVSYGLAKWLVEEHVRR